MKISAAVLRDHRSPYRIEEVDLAEPGPGQVRVRVVGSGMCHTDTLPRVPGLTTGPPLIAGHEGAGVVEALGPGVFDLAVGDHVVLSFDSCQSCVNCRAGHPAYCSTFFERNLSGVGDGAPSPVTDSLGEPVSARWFGQSSFATHANVAARNAVVVDPRAPLQLLGPLGCGVQTGAGAVFNSLRVGVGESITVFGAGAVGLSAVMAATVCGASTIIAVDLHDSRRKLATQLGATHTVDGADTAQVAQAIAEITGDGSQYALDTTGVPSVITTAVRTLRPTGVCGLVGVQLGDLVLDPMALAAGKTVTGIIEGDAAPRVLIPTLLGLWQQGRFPFDTLIATYPLEQINQAEADSLSGTVIKPVLLPQL
ncbi:NAD(P)-dependent alcohol dehydrogenase [Mycobacterium sp. Lab-001]|uniref:NAD(P)-dependent alcohol dehydrogenase n=1 Tax=Mycobacterium sp. Lab-001 TaxID=3410136 RepID=UPI003D16ED69